MVFRRFQSIWSVQSVREIWKVGSGSMEIRYPDYYKKFQCIAGTCPDTCCAGWEISVDPVSERRYQREAKQKAHSNPAFAKKLKKHIKHGRIISEGATCPFLNQEGLCEMYLELGPDSLCETCTRHPRHMEDYGNLHELVLLLSCPEVSRLVLEENESGWYVRNLPERHGNMEGIDEELLNILLKTREQIWQWSADESMSLDECLRCSVSLAHDVQRRLQSGNYEEAEHVLKRYQVPDAARRLKRQLENKMEAWEEDAPKRFLLMSDWMEELAELDGISRDFPELLEQTRKTLYHSPDSRSFYEMRWAQMRDGSHAWARDFRRVFSYYIYSFLLSALYDGDLLTKVKMAALLVMAMEECYMAECCQGKVWNEHQNENGELSLGFRVNVCHALARQIENSDENRAALEQVTKKQFRARTLVEAL